MWQLCASSALAGALAGIASKAIRAAMQLKTHVRTCCSRSAA